MELSRDSFSLVLSEDSKAPEEAQEVLVETVNLYSLRIL